MSKSSIPKESILYSWAVMFFAIHGALQILLLEQMNLPHDFDFIVGGPFLVIGSAFAWFLPDVRAEGMVASWRVPKKTFLIPRSLLRICCSSMIGMAIGALVAAPFVAPQMYLFIASLCAMAGVMAYSTHRRFQKHRCTEWIMPTIFFRVFRPIIRGSKVDTEST